MSVRETTLFFSETRLSLYIECPQVEKAILAALGGCRKQIVPSKQTVRYELRSNCDIYRAGRLLVQANSPEYAIGFLERNLYDSLPEWVAPNLLIHCALLKKEETALLIAGKSGAGKSSFCLEAIGRGFSYFSDDLVVFDGQRLWGIPRSIQFDPVPLGEPLIERLKGCDAESYQFLSQEGKRLILPVFPLPDERISDSPVSAENVVLCFPAHTHGENRIAPCPPLEALERLHEGVLGGLHSNQPDIGRLIKANRCWNLEWSNPAAALELLATRFS